MIDPFQKMMMDLATRKAEAETRASEAAADAAEQMGALLAEEMRVKISRAKFEEENARLQLEYVRQAVKNDRNPMGGN